MLPCGSSTTAYQTVLGTAVFGHLGAVVTRDGVRHPVVLPVAYAVDPAGPDADGTLYLHGSTGAGWLRAALATDMCFTVTELDGLVAARSGFHHSMNYRSAVIIGRARSVDDPDERGRALDLIVDHMIPGRSATLRAATRKELAATAVLAISLREASMKERAGEPVDDPDDTRHRGLGRRHPAAAGRAGAGQLARLAHRRPT